ncbi:MAG: hypothetical protein HKN76_07980 [Saprospiraceae bacterium]|nr:hypothetical protein [Saprospiraceae bacterium]
MKTYIFLLGIMLVVSVGCRSVEKMIDQGNFDRAIDKSMRKIAGKENLGTKHVLAIEAAFSKANDRDIAKIKSVFGSDRAEEWKNAVLILNKIEDRQASVQHFLPLVGKDGYQAKFAFVKTTDLRENAYDSIQKFTHREAKRQLERARLGNKSAARTAYVMFEELWKYSSEYLDGRDLQEESRDLGVSHIQIKVTNQTNGYIPPNTLDQLVKENFENEFWIKYHFDRNYELADREIIIELTDLSIGPERIHEVTHVDRREIEDGFEYVLDHNGNVAKDSLGNDIKRILYRPIKAWVTKTRQQKEAMVRGEIINRNLVSGEVEYMPFDASLIFEHHSGRYRGNRKALSTESRELIGIAPLPFPDNEQMVYDLMISLRPIIGKKLKKNHLLV